jgi:hypothetical protein
MKRSIVANPRVDRPWRRCLTVLSGLAVVAALGGCASLSTTVGMQPHADAGDVPNRRNGTALYLELPGVEFSVAPGRQKVVSEWIGPLVLPIIPTGRSADPVEWPSPFPVEVRLYAWEEGFTFDPMETRLVLADGREVAPAGYGGPSHHTAFPGLDPAFRRHYPCDCWPEHWDQPDQLPHESRAYDVTVAAQRRPSVPEGKLGRRGITCFWLLFDTPVHADSPMRLRVDGLRRSGQPVAVPGITLRKDSFRTFGTVP